MSEDTPRPTLAVIRNELDKPPEANPDPGDRHGLSAKLRPRGVIFPDCPVKALGQLGDTFFYLDSLSQLQAVKKHDRDRIRGIFSACIHSLQAEFPRWSKGGEATKPKIIGWDQEAAATALQTACSEKGIWHAQDKVRGLGAWLDEDGGVVLHCGNKILKSNAWHLPGEIDGYVYPSLPHIPPPAEARDAQKMEHAPGVVLDTIATWQWQRDETDAWLLTGWIAAAMFGGALRWRPAVWMTGDAGSGKSTLQDLIDAIMGDSHAIVRSSDPTEAALRQFLSSGAPTTVPVAIDELEAQPDNRKNAAIVKLARQASSGGVVLRGGSDHQGHIFKVNSAFLFSSILIPPMLDQDLSRLAILNLNPFPPGAKPPEINPAQWRKVGQVLRRQVLRGWPRLAATLEVYRAALAGVGHNARGCDQYGTLLAFADLVMHEHAPDAARGELWAEKLKADTLRAETDHQADWQRMLSHLLGQRLDIFRSGEKLTVEQHVRSAAKLSSSEGIDGVVAGKALGSIGLGVIGTGKSAHLTIANSHPGLASLFIGTQWYAEAAQNGVWVQAARRVPAASPNNVRYAGRSMRGSQFPLASIPGFLDDQAEFSAAADPAAEVF